MRAPSSSAPSSDGASRFAPGTLLAERYRVVSLLGSGGMGEVYRAEDLKLGQTVALKFLSPEAARDEAARQRLYQEVRVGRRVSHPNICRLYDVVEWQGHVFVTMEYVDGEDLASLIRRIGALPDAKALQLAREICAGLAAVHSRGLVHRDLKPANVMIDGRGNARITDFGLALPTDDLSQLDEFAGTPLYMAPEQLRGEAATVRSDLYSLGLVLYEMVTGERLFHTDTPAGLLRQHESAAPSHPRLASASGDPALRRVIARCLEEDSEARPASIHGLVAALPGGDPLQAALDAGETPSPELVAAAGGRGALKPAMALAAFAAFAALVLLNAGLAERWGQVPGYIEVPEPPEALATRAGDLLRDLGASVRDGDVAYGWSFDWDRRHWVEENGFEWRGRGRTMSPSPAVLWYRFSPEDLDPFNRLERVTQRDPPFDRPGMARVRIDAEGRLLHLALVPPRLDSPESKSAAEVEAAWNDLLVATGIDAGSLEEVEPEWLPRLGATHRRAWTGTYPKQPDLPVRIEAAATAGGPVWLEVIPPWVAAAATDPPKTKTARRLFEATLILRALMFLVLMATAALLARRNVRQGRGDSRGALRLALVIGVAAFVQLMARSDLAPASLLSQTIAHLGNAIAETFVAWLLYLAIEPYLRRSWPRLMVGWHRLVAGRLGDPRVAKEALGGLVAGLLLVAAAGELMILFQIADVPYSTPLQSLDRFRGIFAAVVDAIGWTAQDPLWGGLVLVIATFVFRRRTLAICAVWILMFVVVGDWIFDLRYAFALKSLVATFHVVVLLRFGLVGVGTMSLASDLVDLPLTLDPGHWYFAHSLVPLLTLLAFGAWAAWRTLGGQNVLASWLAEDRLPTA